MHTPQPKTKQQQWAPTREGYARFLAESKAVYEAFESVMAAAERPEYAQFQNTGLERAGALAKDLAWFEATYGIKAPEVRSVWGAMAMRFVITFRGC
jgi:heme oxygenase